MNRPQHGDALSYEDMERLDDRERDDFDQDLRVCGLARHDHGGGYTIVAVCPGCNDLNPHSDANGFVDGPRAYHAECWGDMDDDAQQAALKKGRRDGGVIKLF